MDLERFLVLLSNSIHYYDNCPTNELIYDAKNHFLKRHKLSIRDDCNYSWTILKKRNHPLPQNRALPLQYQKTLFPLKSHNLLTEITATIFQWGEVKIISCFSLHTFLSPRSMGFSDQWVFQWWWRWSQRSFWWFKPSREHWVYIAPWAPWTIPFFVSPPNILRQMV